MVASPDATQLATKACPSSALNQRLLNSACWRAELCDASAARPQKPARSAGFTLLELLMAITVLIIIVLMIAIVFQQTHVAWGIGIHRAGAETALRSVMGIIERDLTHAVDPTPFGAGATCGFNPLSANLITLDGTNRMPQMVSYSFTGGNVTRQTYSGFATAPTNWSFNTLTATTIVNGNQPLSMFQFNAVAAPSTASTTGLPLRVEVEAHVKRNDSFAILSGWSEGKNRAGHLEDRIISSP